MSDNKTLKIDLPKKIVEALEAHLKKTLESNQLPSGTTLEQFIELILANYVQSAKMMEQMGGKILSDLKDKLDGIFSGEVSSNDNFYKSMMDNFKNIFDPEESNKKSDDKSGETSKATDDYKKKS